VGYGVGRPTKLEEEGALRRAFFFERATALTYGEKEV
jgi:hypothetical protein